MIKVHLRPMRLVGNVCRFWQAYYHRDSRSVESRDAFRGFVGDSNRYEACVLYECAALEKWGEEVNGDWVGNGAEISFKGSYGYSRDTRSIYEGHKASGMRE